MDILITVLIGLFGLFLHFKSKSDKAEVEKKLKEIQNKDEVLKQKELLIKDAIKAIDDGITKAKEEREKKKNVKKHMTLKERADSIKKGLK